MLRVFSNIIGFDDAPFSRAHRGNVPIIGAVYAGLRFDGVLMGHIRRDGANAARNIAKLVAESKFAHHAQLIMLQGVAFGGFNVTDAHDLSRRLELPVLIVSRRKPDMAAVKDALLTKVSGGVRKWKIIEKLGPMEPIGNIFVQRAGLSYDEAVQVIEKFAVHSHIPEPLRTAHLIAGAVGSGQSRGRP